MPQASHTRQTDLLLVPHFSPPCRGPTYHRDELGIREKSTRQHPVEASSDSIAPLDTYRSTDRLTVYPDGSRPDITIVIAQTSPSRVDLAKWLTIRSAAQDAFVIAHMLRKRPGHGMTEQQTRVAAYAACVHLDPLESLDVWCDEQHISSRALGAGTIHIGDMRHTWRADIRSSFNVVNFYIPQSALDDIADEQDGVRVRELHCPIGAAQVDTVFHNLALALLPALAVPEQTNRLFTDCASRAVISHLARTYGSHQSQPQHVRGGLAPWQGRRAKELLMADLSGDIRLPELANACRLSPSHFCRAFSHTFGCPPYRWLMAQRVGRAKELILNTNHSMSEIALTTGFADQSHFTRAFSRRVGASPAAWRRAQNR